MMLIDNILPLLLDIQWEQFKSLICAKNGGTRFITLAFDLSFGEAV